MGVKLASAEALASEAAPTVPAAAVFLNFHTMSIGIMSAITVTIQIHRRDAIRRRDDTVFVEARRFIADPFLNYRLIS